MARHPESSDALAADLKSRIDRIVAAARNEGREAALAGLRTVLSGGALPKKRGRPAGSGAASKSAATPKKRRKASGGSRANPWARLSPEARLARINAIRKGRGLPPRAE